MTKLVCDLCEEESFGLYTFKIGYNGEPRIGGGSLSWDGWAA